MKKLTFLLFHFFTFLVLTCCSNKDENSNSSDQETSPLNIISYSPTSAFTGDEVTIIAEGIDTLETYTISFNNALADTVIITETEFKVKVPEGATSGVITIDFLDFQDEVGTIEITEELDRIYAAGTNIDYPFDKDGIMIYELNGLSGEIVSIEEDFYLGSTPSTGQGYKRYLTSKQGDFLVTSHWNHVSMGIPSSNTAHVINLNTYERNSFPLSSYGSEQKLSLSALDGSNLFYSNKYTNSASGEVTYSLFSRDLITMENQMIHEFIGDHYPLGVSGVLPSSNSLFSFTKDDNDNPIFLKIGIDTGTLLTTPLPNPVDYRSILVNDEERVFVVAKESGVNYNQIIEIDPENGLPINTIATAEENFYFYGMDYSESTGRFFCILKNGNDNIYGSGDRYLYKVDLQSGNTSKILLAENPRFHQFYLRN